MSQLSTHLWGNLHRSLVLCTNAKGLSRFPPICIPMPVATRYLNFPTSILFPLLFISLSSKFNLSCSFAPVLTASTPTKACRYSTPIDYQDSTSDLACPTDQQQRPALECKAHIRADHRNRALPASADEPLTNKPPSTKPPSTEQPSTEQPSTE